MGGRESGGLREIGTEEETGAAREEEQRGAAAEEDEEETDEVPAEDMLTRNIKLGVNTHTRK